ncbi:hypothetical protein GC088_00820 [Arthrobacter sp. JZ12]|uniref:hypothetical protein n=1 Tax=Arthrobacter sp. JZ12 TaxID=2654190 RepID=UPI002B492F94|nr:hypothetical protein [Arthrobacter sp. JZ12]WRH23806.1 hypothetical protein GC088_00820 [Arthrobacter sp. JZ12]
MTATPAAPQRLAGHNRISTQALTSTACAVAADVLHVPVREIRASWFDDGGLLALSLALPVSIPSLHRVAADPAAVANFGGTVSERVHRAKGAILERVMQLSGSRLSRVDIRVTGARVSETGRAR